MDPEGVRDRYSTGRNDMRSTTTTNVSVDGVMQGLGEPSTNPIAAALNSRPKFVASSSLTDPQWSGTTVLAGDLATAIAELNADHDGELLVPGSGVLVRWLLADDIPWHHHPDLSTGRASGIRNVHGGPGGCVLRQLLCNNRSDVNMDTKRARLGS